MKLLNIDVQFVHHILKEVERNLKPRLAFTPEAPCSKITECAQNEHYYFTNLYKGILWVNSSPEMFGSDIFLYTGDTKH